MKHIKCDCKKCQIRKLTDRLDKKYFKLKLNNPEYNSPFLCGLGDIQEEYEAGMKKINNITK